LYGQQLHYLWTLMPLCGVMSGNACQASLMESPMCRTHPLVLPQVPGNSAQPMEERACMTWQSPLDRSDRLNVAKAIISLFQRTGFGCNLGSKLPDAVRLLELMLYRTAPSKDAYLDEVSLDRRVIAAIQQRASAANRRRLRLHNHPA